MPHREKFRNHDFQISQNLSFWQVFFLITTLFDVFIFEEYY